MNPYEELGVDRGADADTIKRAYKRKAQKGHPDKGGNAEAFHAIQKSYDILSDSARRKRYDERGEDEHAPDPMQVVYQSIATVLLTLIEKIDDIDHVNLVQLVAQNTQSQIMGLISAKKAKQQQISKLERALRRVKKKTRGPNMLAQFIEADIREKKRSLDDIVKQQELGEKILKIVAEYDYDTDPAGMMRGGMFVRMSA